MTTPLNVFKTVTYSITTSSQVVYTAPTGFTSIILMAQIANITSTEETITFSHFNTSTTTETELAKDFLIPGNDAGSLLTGKLVIETGNSIKASASTGSALKLTLSVLESLNA
jgi:hypothetical protein